MDKLQKEVLIIIPAYNEEKNIEDLLIKLEQPEISEIADVLVINDASKDATAAIVRRRNHDVITNVYNLGYGSGLQVGYKFALRKGYKYVIQMDADGQHDVSNVRVLYEGLKTPDADGKCPDIVLGSRFVEGSISFPVSVMKKIAFVLFRNLIKAGTGQKVMDPTTGLQGINRRAFGFYSGYGHFDDKFPDANMIMQMLLLGFKVREVPAVMYARTEGVSMHSGLKPIKYMFRMMISIIAVWIRVRLFKADTGALKFNEDMESVM